MITYKGQKTVIGKKFIYEGEVLKYTGKIYGDSYNFTNDKGIEYILSESDLTNLEEYSLPEADTNIIKNLDSKDTIKNVLIDYTEKELALLNDLIAGKSNDINALNELYSKEIADIQFLNKYDTPIANSNNISLAAQKSYLEDVNRNISSQNIVGLITNLQNFMASNNKEGEQDGNN